MPSVKPDSAETARLLNLIEDGDRQALERLLGRYRADLRAFVEMRIDPRMAARVDPSDVVQETQLEVVGRLKDYLRRRPMPFRLWVRKTAYERLIDLQRHHLRTARRSVGREVALPERSSLLLARPLLPGAGSPSQELMARELAAAAARAVKELPQTDREILLMRHAEAMPFEEIACLLDIEPVAARKRFGRALLRLQKLLSDQGLLE
jgi:RNA polymerase sigma-70 factor, ECF subfamily